MGFPSNTAQTDTATSTGGGAGMDTVTVQDAIGQTAPEPMGSFNETLDDEHH